MSEQTKAVVRRYLDAAFVRHELDELNELVAHEGLIQAARGFVSAFPDIKMTVEHTIAEGDWVAVGVSASGTHNGTFQGHSPTGNRWESRATAWYKVTDARISDAWIVWDWLPIMKAVGAVGESVKAHP